MNLSTSFSVLVFLFVALNTINATSLKATSNFDTNTSITTSDAPPSFFINGKDVCIDENFTVPITINNFELITSFQFTISWDDQLLNFDSISYMSPGLGSTLFFNEINTDDGTLTVQWYDINVAGVSLENFMDIFSIDFTVLADNQTSINVTFEDLPTMKEVSGIVDNDIKLIVANYNDGMIHIDQQELDTYEVINDIDYSNIGAVNITIVNGTFPYEYVWSTDAETENIENVGIGDYSVTITDTKGCIETFGPFIVDNIVNVNKISSLQSINLYPNPAKNLLHLNAVFENTEDLEITIFNVLGKKVLVEQHKADNLNIDLNVSDLSVGIYFVQLKTENGAHTEKLEILH